MKKIVIISIVLFLIVNHVAAQDTLYVYKAGQVVTKKAVNDLDSLSFTYTPPVTGTVNDIDGNTYHWIKIGTQTWMVENLNTTKFRTGESISNILDATTWGASSFSAWCDYNNDPTKGSKYGKLYNWYAASDSRNIAPTGWHVATNAEWTTLMNYLIASGRNYDDTHTGNKVAKSLASVTDWSPDTGIGTIGNNLLLNNSSGFNGLPAGYRDRSGSFSRIGTLAIWWSSTAYDSNYSWFWSMSNDYNSLGNSHDGMFFTNRSGFSVRCLKD